MSSKPVDKSFLRLVPSDLDDFESPFSLVSDYAKQRHLYLSDKDYPSLSILSFPESCRLSTISFQYHVNQLYNKKTGTNPLLFYFLEYGLNCLKQEPEIEDRILLQQRFQASISSVDIDIISAMSGYMEKFKPSYIGGKRWNFPISPELFTILSVLTNDLCIQKADLACLAIMHTLSESPYTNPGHIAEMEDTVRTFISVLGKKNIGLKASLDAYGFPELKKED